MGGGSPSPPGARAASVPARSADALSPHLTVERSFIAGSRPPPTGERGPEAPPRAALIGRCGSAWLCCYPALPGRGPRVRSGFRTASFLRVPSGCGWVREPAGVVQGGVLS